MKMRRVRLAVAIAATLAAPMAHALGLGQITVRSGLNEPLRAEIPLFEVSEEELPGIQTRLASAADFARVGLSVGDVPAPFPLRRLLEGCDAVVNLVGILYESGRRTFQRIHAEGAANVAKAAAAAVRVDGAPLDHPDGLLLLLDHPECGVDELMALVKGPDFPTGGLIIDDGEGLRQARLGLRHQGAHALHPLADHGRLGARDAVHAAHDRLFDRRHRARRDRAGLK